MSEIERFPGPVAGRSAATAYENLVFTVATSPEKPSSMKEQTAGALRQLDERLALAGSDKTRLLSATVYITDMSRKAEMDEAWTAWVDPAHPPQRACVCAGLEGPTLVEITVVAVRKP